MAKSKTVAEATDSEPTLPSIVVQFHSHHEETPDQYEVLADGKRVAYVCVGEHMPINWLPKEVIGITLTQKERIAIARIVREQMVAVNAAEGDEDAELERLSAGGQ